MSKEISEERLQQLYDAERKLDALEAGGVSKWEWYGESLETYNQEKKLEKKLDEMLEDMLETLSLGAYEPSERGAGYAFKKEHIDDAKRIMLRCILPMIHSEGE
jgi:hypothetical protein